MTDKVTLGPDGLCLPIEISLSKMQQDEHLLHFATGLIPAALAHLSEAPSLSTALYHGSTELYPLWTVLLALDAEIESAVAGTTRVFPLPGFFSYRHSLSPEKSPLRSLRLPPLNPDGHFSLNAIGDGHLALRLDLEPTTKLLGHVRLALSHPDRFPLRLRATEHRLDRRVLTEEIVALAVAASEGEVAPSLTEEEIAGVTRALMGLIAG